MYRASASIHIHFAHHVRGHSGPCISLHGHTWKFEVVLEAKKGSHLIVMQEQDGWVLVMAPSKNKADAPNLGWVSLADLLRP
jgi:6-pyruvoyl-tetrahydropterin synthase